MSKEVDTLRARLDAFSRQLDAKIREFKVTGELKSKETIEILRKRQEALKTKLDRAIRAGAEGKGVRCRNSDRGNETMKRRIVRHLMSAIGPNMSAFAGKADMTFLRRTCRLLTQSRQMEAFPASLQPLQHS
jgi:hypothetical protein